MTETDADGRTVLRVPGDLALADASETRRALMETLAGTDGALAIGLAAPVEGVLGLQLALAAAASLEAEGRFAGFAADASCPLREAIR
ncbi:MAG: hypothetical protein ACFBWO_13655 [Paracoccaceae bacterium]